MVKNWNLLLSSCTIKLCSTLIWFFLLH
jgi:hypothetical protein